jgi:hypothetical protein
LKPVSTVAQLEKFGVESVGRVAVYARGGRAQVLIAAAGGVNADQGRRSGRRRITT